MEDEAAYWAVETWAIALGFISSPLGRKEQAPKIGNPNPVIAPKQVQDASHWIAEGNKCLANRMYEEAIACYDNALTLDPENRAEIFSRQSDAYEKLGKYAEAERAVRISESITRAGSKPHEKGPEFIIDDPTEKYADNYKPGFLGLVDRYCQARGMTDEVRRWKVYDGHKQHTVEYDCLMIGSGHIKVDGKLVDSWGPSLMGFPEKRDFYIDNKPARLRRRGTLNQHFDLIFQGRVYDEKEGRI